MSYLGASPVVAQVDGYNQTQMDAFLGSQNLIINGAMQVAQRGTSFAATSSGDYTVDRFQMNGDIGTWTASQDTDAPEGFAYSHKLLLTSGFSIGSLDYWSVQQKIEGQNLQMLKYGTANALSVTLGFWVKSNVTGTFCVNLYQADGNKNYPNTYTINSADTWEFKTITYAGDTVTSLDNDTNESLRVIFLVAAGSGFSSGTAGTRAAYTDATFAAGHSAQLDATNDYINITGVQLVPGETLPPFRHEPYGDVLQKCLRYYWNVLDSSVTSGHPILNVNAYSSSNNYGVLNFPVEMRAAPTMSYSAVGDFRGRMSNSVNCTSVNTQGTHQTTRVCMYFQSTSTAGDGGWVETANSSAELAFNAEL